MDNHDGVTGAFMAVMQNGGLTQEGSVLTTDTIRVGRHHHLHGNRTAGAGEWHPVTVTLHRPSRPA